MWWSVPSRWNLRFPPPHAQVLGDRDAQPARVGTVVCLKVAGCLRQAKEEPVLLAICSPSPVPRCLPRSRGSSRSDGAAIGAAVGSGQGAWLDPYIYIYIYIYIYTHVYRYIYRERDI